MAYDGIVTYAISLELSERVAGGKIEKLYQPEPETLVLQIHTQAGNYRLLASCGTETARVCLTDERYKNPEQPPGFCMLLRKHIQSGHISQIAQRNSERIIEIDIQTLSELGFVVQKRLIIEIMGKHSNIVLIDLETYKVIDCIKRISIDVNRYRQLLPGIVYKYPPEQDKTPFKEVSAANILTRDPKLIMNRVSGISPAIARMLSEQAEPAALLEAIVTAIAQTHGDQGTSGASPEPHLDTRARVYLDSGTPKEFHITDLPEYSDLEIKYFDTVSSCVEYYYQNRKATNAVRIKSIPLVKLLKQLLDKSRLKKKRLAEDIIQAEDSESYRLYGELLTANIHLVAPGAKSVVVTNYYNGEAVEIPLDEKLAASKNAQQFFKKYAKAKTAVKIKAAQLAETEQEISYLESVLQNAEAADTAEALDEIKDELVQTGYVRYRAKAKARKRKAAKPHPLSYRLSDGSKVLVGKNNIENDYLSTKYAARSDLWFHTKDIPGSHTVLIMDGRSIEELPDSLIYEAAQIAAYHSKGRESENVPVDFTYIKYVKKPSGAKPGMVIFTHNTTVYVNPQQSKILPDE